ncbi:hypothetical protein MGG_16659 [Pyricularia oryzae 70-15]|uniref:Uncharacterized protein n=3 Tax=Pyricularia oryzae TaxID=318829 RepID=G4N2I0_PYRO7|nr:uncharacterized protein MGG_16659 [Pyricularia oryzae 70-15]ELQ42899.1 hypothetical protein OOU_Y34scaffold00187g2 [Pyricularia oryzae Y34]KAH8846838.1 hypothetical protein MCOR01_000286 [Pyricularia oryzae]EHA51689.1 hypothetical protein MGG_16659 [Pyricularia oryzae 70-15]KAI6266583.1 hypothetical protein MCOR26_010103 [Pyricularia oryzae]KAI6338630.1 hypothetical protein MCOR28_007769 [Pyricularia oryzae]
MATPNAIMLATIFYTLRLLHALRDDDRFPLWNSVPGFSLSVWKATANLIRYGRIKKKVRFDMSHLEQSTQQADEEL